MKRKRTIDDIKKAIKDQLTFITNSCFLYDLGCDAEALRIAGAINVLVEKRRKSKGLLWRLGEEQINLLLTVEKTEDINPDRLIVDKCDKPNEIDSIINKYEEQIKDDNIYLLIYVESEKIWHVYVKNSNGNIIKTPLNNLKTALGYPEKNKLLVITYINNLSKSDHNFDDAIKQLIVRDFDCFLGYKKNVRPCSWNPMIACHYIGEKRAKPILESGAKNTLSIKDWYEQAIFQDCTDFNDFKIFTLTRRLLIESVRDQDGIGHFDLKLKSDAYIHAKHGSTVAIFPDGSKITTENYHLVMLRQLGYEILNSKIEILLE